ncbi:MAG: DNA cytosine methyltransferase, partial [Thermodesulfovibrionales bacterium]|nr:DNA cytosine methyltransferase [Thermodesulfovibrionales bacterium]
MDLFAGIGGFRLGLERAGWECAWSNDWDRWACAVYRRHWGGVEEADVRSVDPKGIPDADMVVAGFPCQPFSCAGKMLGFRDERGTLFFEVVRILKEKRPPLVLLENVKGLGSVQGGECFAAVLRT